MKSENIKIAEEIKQKNVIDMGLTFSAMIRLFEKDTKQKIACKLYEELQNIKDVKTLEEFNEFHNNFCAWFTKNIKTAQKERDNKIIKTPGYALYGHAAKLIYVVLKVYVYYSSLPDKETAVVILPFMNTAIDTPILNHLKRKFPKETIQAKTVEQIDQILYGKLQSLIKKEIITEFNNDIIPAQYDDIMWNRLNREN